MIPMPLLPESDPERPAPLVLIAETWRQQRFALQTQLEGAGYRVISASSGQQALDLCAAEPPAIVLYDSLIEDVGPADFCARLRSTKGNAHCYVIALLPRDADGAPGASLAEGGDDFISKPIAAPELLARVQSGMRIIDLQAAQRESREDLQETLEHLRAAQSAIDRDLIEARKLQQAIGGQGHRNFGTLDVSSLLQSAAHIGGDLVGVFPVNSRCAGFYAIDVSGHGVTAALLTARLSAMLSPSLDQNVALRISEWGLYEARGPVELAKYLNHLMTADFDIDSYFTMVYGLADMVTGEIRLVQAGHPHPLVMRSDGRIEKIGRGGMPIGLIEDARYEEIKLTLAQGERLLIVSDGLIEAEAPSGGELGDDGLRRMVEDNAHLSGETLLARLRDRVMDFSGFYQNDDISALLIEFGDL